MAKEILIIEDEPGIMMSLKDEFESQGYVVYAAEDGEKGLDLARKKKPDLIILDPPRAGLHPDLFQGLLRLKTKGLVYTSCNPATLARDLKLLASRYRVEKVQPLDMFPQTAHIECVASLRWNSPEI